MANVKRNIINVSAGIVAILFVVGALNMDAVLPMAHYVNAHTEGWVTFLYYAVGIGTFFFFPLIIGAALEVPLWESNTRIGLELSNAMTNARNSWLSFFAVGLSGGIVTFFGVFGAATIICAF